MLSKMAGTLIISGGRENIGSNPLVLSGIASGAAARTGRLILLCAEQPTDDAPTENIVAAFRRLGVRSIDVIGNNALHQESTLSAIDKADALYITGENQRYVLDQISGSALHQCLHSFLGQGGLIAGTSAAAAAFGDVALLSNKGGKSPALNETETVNGLGLYSGVIIDTRFAQVSCIGRLLGAVSRHPNHLGIGIDEDTAIRISANNGNYDDNGNSFEVIGSQAVYVVDGSSTSYSNVSDPDRSKILTMAKARLHMLSHGSKFELRERRFIL